MSVVLHGCEVCRADPVVAGSPMSLYDFYMYLRHIEYSAENLEFYIWWVLMPCL
jgi:hypothetical protein